MFFSLCGLWLRLDGFLHLAGSSRRDFLLKTNFVVLSALILRFFEDVKN